MHCEDMLSPDLSFVSHVCGEHPQDALCNLGGTLFVSIFNSSTYVAPGKRRGAQVSLLSRVPILAMQVSQTQNNKTNNIHSAPIRVLGYN